ncbi:YdcH family protein [Roseomonas frigidaquae]|uniref:YdcH family protein n=1 Tax=Falsiroseomonas frigidaquae TaxID=487318 RepID=A0ABX1F5L3_9PROT|nr:YdcH family protein [Falsiroseomonas frigidaquae]NKE47560.1 YdcH family protein [Falsiroseomonas frigidaquae]
MEGVSSASGGALKLRLVERLSDLERLIAVEQARSAPDTALIRRLSREKLLAKDRMAALGGCGMPRWAREDGAS